MPEVAPLGRADTRSLREVYRSAGWPCQDMLEIELLAAGLLQRVANATGLETLRLTDAGIACLAASLAGNRLSLSKHEALVSLVAGEMVRAGRIAWRGLALRARLDAAIAGGPARWCMAKPDVFSIRNTSVAAYLDPIVHEIKVHRSDLLGDLRRPEKRAAYLDLGGEAWYVLGADAKGKPIASPEEVPRRMRRDADGKPAARRGPCRTPPRAKRPTIRRMAGVGQGCPAGRSLRRRSGFARMQNSRHLERGLRAKRYPPVISESTAPAAAYERLSCACGVNSQAKDI